jgi:hypothetical protein
MMEFRALELHGKSFWDHRKLILALDTAARYGLNALVLHESDFTTEFLYPKPLFDPEATWSGAPARRGENALQNNQAYMRYVLREAGKRGIEVWVETIELTFPDELVERFPELLENGKVCPSHPYWPEFLEMKYRDLGAAFPGLKGAIVSAGSPEGRAAFSQKKCACARCKGTKLSEWYENLIRSMHTALSSQGMALAVREFSYTPEHQNAIAQALERLPSDIILCVKTTPHDFYPTFPDNPQISAQRGRDLWIEYDTMGQFYGWGAFPCIMAADIARRFDHFRAHGVKGAVLRVEWERVNDWWSLDTPNRMNLYIAAKASRDVKVDEAAALANWLEEEGVGANGNAASGDAVLVAAAFLADTWAIIKGALYINDFVFNDSSRFPMTRERAWWSMKEKHSLASWDSTRRHDLDLDEEKLSRYLAEKDEALILLRRWMKRAEALGDKASAIPFFSDLPRFAEYVDGWRIAGRLCLLSKVLENPNLVERREGISSELVAAKQEAASFSDRMSRKEAQGGQRHQFAMLADPRRISRL